jgi:3-hydroxyisobutyrate dehydrogenase
MAELKAGFIGLGNLGSAIARRLLDQGVDLTVWNRTASKARGLNTRVADSPKELCAGNRVVLLNLFDSDAVGDVLLGPNGILRAECEGHLIIDTTTNHFKRVESFHKAVEDRGAAYLEAPVAGSVAPALQGNLTMMVSGKRAAFDSASPFLNMTAKNIFFLEIPGSATKMKLVNNLVMATFMAAIAEGIVIGERAGLAKEIILDILMAGGGNSAVLNAKKAKLLAEDFSPHFSTGAILKDLRYAEEMASTFGFASREGKATYDAFMEALNLGFADQDFSSVYAAMKQGAPSGGGSLP